MAITATGNQQLAWWREPTREQWHAWIAAWLGWTLDAFDFTIFLLLMLPISQTFSVPLVDVTAVLAITLWMRLVDATASGWLADRMGRKKPLMISIAWYSVANLLAGLAPTSRIHSVIASTAVTSTSGTLKVCEIGSISNKKIVKSKASRVQPSHAAIQACHCSRVGSLHQASC